MREEKRWLRHENGFSHFSFGCKNMSTSNVRQAKYNSAQNTVCHIQYKSNEIILMFLLTLCRL